MPEPSSREDLRGLVAAYLSDTVPNPPLDAVVDFYLAAKLEAVRPPCMTESPRVDPSDLKSMHPFKAAALHLFGVQLFRLGATAICSISTHWQCVVASAVYNEKTSAMTCSMKKQVARGASCTQLPPNFMLRCGCAF